MIPLHDDNPTTIKPVVTVGIIAAATAVFLWQITLPEDEQLRVVYGLGLVPAVLFGERALPPEIAMIPAEATVLTSMFLHGGLLHLAGNMLYLWIFGNNVEDALGHGRFILFYLLCGVAAAFAQIASDPGSDVPMIGASGAIGGVLGAYLLLFPHAQVMVLIPLGIFTRLVYVPALLVLGLWFVLQFVQGALAPASGGGGVAFWAHIGGFVAGAALILIMRRPGVPLFGAARHRPWAQERRRGPWDRGSR